MKKITACFVLITMFMFIMSGCGMTASVPTFEELIEINNLENVFKDHTNVYVNIESKSSLSDNSYTEEVIYVKGDTGLNYHKKSKVASDTGYAYTSRVGNAFYYTDDEGNVSILMEGEKTYFDHTLDFDSTPIGKGYIENGQIVYHSYNIFEADEIMFEASRYDYTLYFNKDTKLLERMDYISYNSDHQVECEYTSTVSYDVADIENKLDKTCYEIITSSERVINLEVIANVGTPEQTSYSFVATTDSQVYAEFNNLTYLLYTDSACQNLVLTLDEYTGEKSMTLYAKIYKYTE